MASATFTVQQDTALTNSHISLNVAQTASLRSQLKSQRGILNSNNIKALCSQYAVSEDSLLQGLVPLASEFSVAPVSLFHVGAIVKALDENGDIHFYFGANVEFNHQALSLVVHAEQSAINNAWLNGAKKILKIAISDAPCGYCRQFMNELADAKEFDILLPNQQFTLAELLPHSFGPTDLGNEFSLFNPKPQLAKFNLDGLDETFARFALNAYVPYSQNFCAVKIVTFNDGDFYGSYAENAAYSPSLSPLQSALSQFFLAGLSFNESVVKGITLLETKGQENQAGVAKAVLASFSNLPALEIISAPLKE
ncbi:MULTISPECIES: cytidine deaminase [Pseudoalteromonas]|jgi:cytidine deaminase|uniref:Cytidine deaminase n=1 Tax=Pseudoalteromonas aliena SW19 TaxID=1314866 RepID=A0ABR9E4M5_9GAMM|nr:MULTISPECIES: cytidine deaminase [Pseudoalteromonas]MBE0361559.1 cytidine deaminase [Pseudoalteromonas aliena SW19]TMN94768.1 cytidine deaminase [Pseudoalteromonas sp. S558]